MSTNLKSSPIIITGAQGRLGRAVTRELTDRGITWRGVDLHAVPEHHPSGDFMVRKADLRDFGAVIEVLRGARAIVHLANYSFPGFQPDQEVLTGNLVMNYNVFAAATLLGIPRVVWLSSETAGGIPFEHGRPRQFPYDEQTTVMPINPYGLSKRLSETMAEYHAVSGTTSYVGFRAALVQDARDYASYHEFQGQPLSRRWHFWNYIDAGDLARACRLGLDANFSGAHILNIAAADTVVDTPSRDLVEQLFGHGCWVPWSDDPFACLADIRKAETLIGFAPEISWRTSKEGNHNG